jgi:hypothetical protein
VVLNHAAEYVGSSVTESHNKVSRQLFMMLNHGTAYDVESCCILGSSGTESWNSVSRQLCMMLNHAAE